MALGLQTGDGIALAGVVESGYGRDLVDQLPQLTRLELRALREPGVCWERAEPATAEIKYLEWVPGRGSDMLPGSVGLPPCGPQSCDLAGLGRPGAVG